MHYAHTDGEKPVASAYIMATGQMNDCSYFN